jgi:hypothetical protein
MDVRLRQSGAGGPNGRRDGALTLPRVPEKFVVALGVQLALRG